MTNHPTIHTDTEQVPLCELLDTDEEWAEYLELAQLYHVLRDKLATGPLSVADVASAMKLSPETIRLAEQRGLYKLKQPILTTCPEIIPRNHKPNTGNC